jgi:ribonuclease P protein component
LQTKENNPLLPRYRLSKQEILRGKKCLDQLFKTGQKFTVQPCRVFFVYTSNHFSPVPLRFAITVPKRFIKKAHDRNRVNRLFREAFRLQSNELKEKLKQNNCQIDFMIVFNRSELPDFSEVSQIISQLFSRLTNVHETTLKSATHRPD